MTRKGLKNLMVGDPWSKEVQKKKLKPSEGKGKVKVHETLTKSDLFLKVIEKNPMRSI